MTSKRKSFVLHKDSLEILPELTDDQAGKLFKAIYAYQIDDEIALEPIVKMVFLPFKNQFARDNSKYLETCERRAVAGSLGGKQKVANASKCKQELANVADSVSKNKSDSDSKSEVTKDIVAHTPVFNFKSELLALGVDKDILNDWMKVRKNKSATNTKSALSLLVSQINKSGLTIDQGVRFANSENWGAFKLSWYQNKSGVNNGHQSTSQKLSAHERVKQRNDAKYRSTDECGLGMGENDRNMGRTMDKGTRGATIEHVDNEPFVDY